MLWMWNSSQLTKAEGLLEPVMTWRKSSTPLNALCLSGFPESFFFVDLVWMRARSFHGLCAPMAGWQQWLQGSLWRQKCVSFTQIFSLSSYCRASLGGNLGSDMISVDLQLCFALFSLGEWATTPGIVSSAEKAYLIIAWCVRMSQDSVWNSFLLVQPSASAAMGRYCMHRLPRRALACGEKQGCEVEGPISSGSTLLWYTRYCRALGSEAIAER